MIRDLGTAVAALSASPLIVAVVILVAVAVVHAHLTDRLAPCTRGHYFRRHPSGTWCCDTCGTLQDRHRRPIVRRP